MVKPDDTLCAYCGMTCAQREYHPYGVCLMFKACRNSETVRANLAAMREHFQAEVRKDDEALIRQMLEALETGHEAATQVAAEFHTSYKGHRPDTHAALDADVERIAKALAGASPRSRSTSEMWRWPRSTARPLGIGGTHGSRR